MSRAVEELNRRLLRARDAMDRAYAERLDVRAVAAVARLSEAHFIRSFRGCFGETPHRYLQRQRHSDPAAGEGGGSSFVTTVRATFSWLPKRHRQPSPSQSWCRPECTRWL
jgi:methylphosphotriester-DNA--protein-cysteine methyltransferase